MSVTVQNYMKSRQNLSKIVVDYIKESILAGFYKEGDHILETEVANTLGISRAPVREAIKELEKEGIVQTLPRRGTFVTKFSLDDIKEVFEIRMLLENNIFKILIYENKLSEEDFSKLEGLVLDMERIAGSSADDMEKSIKLNLKDMEFHRYLWNKSGSKRRVQILEQIFFQLRMAMLYDTNETGDLSRTATDHYEIIDALKDKDIFKCKEALQKHITTYKDAFVQD
ncbi:MAG: GntR family transcriptional regulator [Gudongella sp.]|nr:GntR family transcriptional regulator [Gudongella sp.]